MNGGVDHGNCWFNFVGAAKLKVVGGYCFLFNSDHEVKLILKRAYFGYNLAYLVPEAVARVR